MKRFATLCVLLVALVGISGCANNSPDGLIKQQTALQNNIADLLESNAPESAMAPLRARHEELKKKIDALPAEERTKALDQNKDAHWKANVRVRDALLKRMGKEGVLDKDKKK